MKKSALTIEGINITPREQEIIKYCILDVPQKQIPGFMHISEGTYKTEKRMLHTKLRLHSTSSLILYCLQHGFGYDGLYHEPNQKRLQLH